MITEILLNLLKMALTGIFTQAVVEDLVLHMLRWIAVKTPTKMDDNLLDQITKSLNKDI